MALGELGKSLSSYGEYPLCLTRQGLSGEKSYLLINIKKDVELSTAPELRQAAELAAELGLISKTHSEEIEHTVDDAVDLLSDFAFLISEDAELKELIKKKCIAKRIATIKKGLSYKCIGKYFSDKELIEKTLTDFTLFEDKFSDDLIYYYLKSKVDKEEGAIVLAVKAGNKFYYKEMNFHRFDKDTVEFLYSLIQ